MDWKQLYQQAAEQISAAQHLLITTGAGMGVDSGLPDFRGDEGFWKAYPPFAKLGVSFAEAANPKWFFRDPHRAWGFYGHRFNLYASTRPHAGFEILKRWCQQKSDQYFVFTSNVDGHFEQAGFDPGKIVECHGSINHWQCVACCTDHIGEMTDYSILVDDATFLARDPLPTCPNCGDLVRPNVLMFGDYQWVEHRTQEQILRYNNWLRSIDSSELLVIEIGAGKAVPTVRWESESQEAKLVRINPRDPEAPAGSISIPEGGLAALQQIDALVAF